MVEIHQTDTLVHQFHTPQKTLLEIPTATRLVAVCWFFPSPFIYGKPDATNHPQLGFIDAIFSGSPLQEWAHLELRMHNPIP